MLYKYQKNVLENSQKNYLYSLDTGTGKTLIALHHYYRYAVGKQLIIIAPAAKVKERGWEREINAFIKYYNISDIKFQIVNYQSIHKLDLTDVENSFMILDECHYVKNYKAKRSKEIVKLTKLVVGFIGLSATIASNGWIDTINYFLMFGLYKNASRFLKEFAIYELMNFGAAKVNQIVGWKDEEYLKALFDSISSPALKKENCLDLPGLMIQNKYFKRSRVYNLIKRDRVLDGVKYDTPAKLIAGLRLNGNLHGKVNYLIEQIKWSNGNIVVFYNFQAEYDFIKEEFEKNKIKIDYEVRGGVNRLPEHEEFDTVKNTVTLVQIQAGGTGIELTYSNLVIFFSPTWSYQDYEQALGRAYRNGQKRKVMVYRFKVEKTIDNDIYEALNNKKDFSEKLFLRELNGIKELNRDIENKTVGGNDKMSDVTDEMEENLAAEAAHEIVNNWQTNGEIYNDETGEFEPMLQPQELTEIIPTAGPEVTENRHLYIGGSDLPALFNISDYKDQFELAQEKAQLLINEFTGNEYTTYGHIMEPKIRDYINEKYNFNFEPGTLIKEDEKVRANYDGYDSNKNLLLEIKTNNGKKTDLTEYNLQMQLYMWALDIEEGLLVQYTRPDEFYTGIIFEKENTIDYFNTEFIPGNVKIIKVKRNNEAIEKILKNIGEFWERVEWLKENQESIPEAYYMLSKPKGLLTYDLYNKTLLDMEKYQKKIKTLKETEDKLKEARDLINAYMSEYGVKSFKNEKISMVRVLPTKAKKFDSENFEKDHPELYKKYLKYTDKKGFVKIEFIETKASRPTPRKGKKKEETKTIEHVDNANENEKEDTGESIEFTNNMIRWVTAKEKKINSLTNTPYSMWRPEKEIVRVVQNQNKENCVLDFSFNKSDMSVKLSDDSNFDKTIPVNFEDYNNIIKAMPAWVTFEEKKESEK